MINTKKVVVIADYAFTSRGVTPTNISNTKKASASYLHNTKNKSNIRRLGDVSGLGITSVVIPSTVASIGAGAFLGNKLTEITIPSSVTSIGIGAFRYNELIEVTISNGVTSIMDEAFMSNQLTEVTIPSSVTSIGGSAFAGNRVITIINNSSIENSSDVWNKIIGARGCDSFYVDSITDNVIKISQSTGPC